LGTSSSSEGPKESKEKGNAPANFPWTNGQVEKKNLPSHAITHLGGGRQSNRESHRTKHEKKPMFGKKKRKELVVGTQR